MGGYGPNSALSSWHNVLVDSLSSESRAHLLSLKSENLLLLVLCDETRRGVSLGCGIYCEELIVSVNILIHRLHEYDNWNVHVDPILLTR